MSSMRRRRERLAQRDDAIRRQMVSSILQTGVDGDAAGTIEVAEIARDGDAAPSADVAGSADAAHTRPKVTSAPELPGDVATADRGEAVVAEEGGISVETPPRGATSGSIVGEGSLANKSTATKAGGVGRGGVGARRRRLEERMELREGMQPAARVVRVDRGGKAPSVVSSSSTSAASVSATSSRPIQSPGDSSHAPRTPEEREERVAVAKAPRAHPSLLSLEMPGEEGNRNRLWLDGDVAAQEVAGRADCGVTDAASDVRASARRPSVVLRDSILERRPVPTREDNPRDEAVGGKGEGRRRQRLSKFKSSLGRRHSPPSVVDRGVGGGFPSLEVPVGALALNSGKREQRRLDRVDGKNDVRGTSSISTNSGGGVHRRTTEASASPVELIDNDGSHGMTENGNGMRRVAPGSLHDEDEADEDRRSSADAVLKGMSNTEVIEAIEEIESSLSPDMIKFLRDRGRQKMAKKETKRHQQELQCENPEQNSNQSVSAANESGEIRVGNRDDNGNAQGAHGKQIPLYKYLDQPSDLAAAKEEKMEMVTSGGQALTEQHHHDLAKIRTTQDLDEAFATLQPPSERWKLKPFVEPRQWEEERVRSAVTSASKRKNAGDQDALSPMDELATATALLRSSAPRQRLLGVKTVHRILEEEVKKSRGGAVVRTGTCEVPLVKPWPPLLPVALRCLLDTPSPRKHRLLHSYVLRCMYLLLMLFANPHHAMPGFHGEGDADSPIYRYQHWFMDDGVPTPPLSDAYAPGRLTPSSLGGDDEKKDSEDSSMVACYATNSSAESAISDGSEFYRDPMWVLLSKMRFLPCVAALLTSSMKRSRSSLSCSNAAAHPKGRHGVSRDICGANSSEEWNEQGARMPDESFAAICGILSMMSVRSPGAACAIAEHESILPLIIEHALNPGADGWDEGVANVSPDVDASAHDAQTVRPCGDGDHSAHANPANVSFVVDPLRARPALAFLCALARQSRRAAYSSPYDTAMAYVQAILAMKAEHDEEWEVQKLALILWRTLLRYGFGLPYLSTFISLSASSIAMQVSERSIAAEYLACFANVCECSRVVTQLKQSPTRPKVELTPEQRNTIGMARMWLAPHVQQNSLLLNLEREACGQGSYSASTLKLAASRIRLMACYISAATHIIARSSSGASDNAGESKNDADDDCNDTNFYPVHTTHESLASLRSVIGGGMMEFALHRVLQQNPNVNSLSGQELDVEASACALVRASVALLDAIGDAFDRNISEDDRGAEHEFAEVSSQLHRLVMKVLLAEVGSAARKPQTNPLALEGDTHIARVGWLNAAHFAVVKLLCSQPSEIFVFDSNSAVDGSSTAPETNFGGSDIRDDLCVSKEKQRLCFSHFRELAFSLLGKLQRGEEYMASVMLRQNMLFALQHKAIIQESSFPADINSSTQNILLRELWKSECSRNQFDHSCKLRGTGKVAVGRGPFALQSLRSDAESMAPSTSPGGKDDDDAVPDRTTENLLPLGQMWLWHLLSGSVSPTHGEGVPLSQRERKRKASLEETAKALAECLGLLHEMEFLSEKFPCSDGNENRSYEASPGMFTGHLQSGAKLYHLCNICMLPEEVIRNDDVRRLFIPLFLFYSSSCKNHSVRTNMVGRNLVGSFVNSCYLHSQISKAEGHLDLRRRKEQRMLAFDNSDSSEAQLANFADEELRALDDFAGDMCDVFLEYGAQYEEYVYCIRFLLCHEIPPSVRSRIIHRLRDVLHLLTTEEEKCSPGGNSIAAALRQGLCGGLTSKDGSRRDSAEVLDAFAAALKNGESLATPSRLNAADGGYAYLMAVACMSRNLASASQDGGHGIEACRARLQGMESETLGHVIHVARRLLSENGDKEALIEIVLDVCVKKKDQVCDLDHSSLGNLDVEDDLAWKVVINVLHSAITK